MKLSNILDRAKAAKAAKKTKPAAHSNSKSHDLLYGSGLTKRKAEAAQKQQSKLQEQSFLLSSQAKNSEVKTISLNIPDSLMDSSIILDEYQQAAVDGLKNEKYGCLIGQAGVGKTTTAKALIAALSSTIPTIDLNLAKMENKRSLESQNNAAICIVSFMGKAVQQIKRALPISYHPLCNTIHSTLAYAPVKEEYTDEETGQVLERKVFRPQFTATNKLPFKLCVIDEAGSVPVHLFNELVAALPDDCRIILMGDLNQLPPVTGRSVLGFAIVKWPTFVLSKIHRQKGGNPIIENSDRIIKGMKPLPDAQKFIIKTVPDSAFDAFQYATATLQTLSKNGLFDPFTDAFIVPQNIDTLGQVAFNEKLVRFFNPIKKVQNIAINPPVIITAGWQTVTFAVGDKVMITANNDELGLTNGMIGVVKEIIPNPAFKGEAVANQLLTSMNSSNFSLDLTSLNTELKEAEAAIDDENEDAKERQASHKMVIKFQNVEKEISFHTAGAFTDIIHSYAMTCHKSQGSEYDTVVILIHSMNFRMLSREWLYTAVTRAKNRVVILCNSRGMTKAVNRQIIKGTTIEEKAACFTKLSKANDTCQPNLGEPEKVIL